MLENILTLSDEGKLSTIGGWKAIMFFNRKKKKEDCGKEQNKKTEQVFQQYHFHDMDPNWVVTHAYNMASYLLNNDNPIKDGDTIDGIREGRFEKDIQWRCQRENALIQPSRMVIDVCMGEYASGRRD